MALEHRQTMTVEEYFLLERNDPDARYEYVDGHIYAMAGGTFNHDTIKSNIQRILWGLLRGGKCRGYNSDIKNYNFQKHYFHSYVTTLEPAFSPPEQPPKNSNPESTPPNFSQ